MDGAALGYRATTYFPVKDSLPETRSEEVAHIVYDGAKGKYIALVIFATKAWGIYDAEVRPDGSIRFTAREMANLEAGMRSRWTLTRKADGTLLEELDLAPSGKGLRPVPERDPHEEVADPLFAGLVPSRSRASCAA